MTLRQTRQLDFASLFYNAGGFAALMDVRGTLIAFNRAAQSLTLFDEREVIGLTLPQLCEEASAAEIRKLLSVGGKPTSRLNLGLQLLTKGGRPVSVTVCLFPLFEEEGAPSGWFVLGQRLGEGFARDRETPSLFGALLDSLHAAVFSFDLGGGVLTWSRACEFIFGYSRAEAEGKMSARRLFQDPGRLDALLQTVGESGVYSGELICLARDGSPRLGQVLISPLRDAGEKTVGHTCIFQDVSEQRRVEQFTKVFFEHAGEAIFIVDAVTKKIVDANARALELHGYTREEFLRLTTPELHPRDEDPERVAAIFERLDQTGRFQSENETHRRKDGSALPVSMNIRRVNVAGRTYSICIVQDLSLRKRAEGERDALRRLSQRLTEPMTIAELARAVAEESRRLFRHEAFLLYVRHETEPAVQAVYAEDTPPGENEPRVVEVGPEPRSLTGESPAVKNEPTLINRTEDPVDTILTPFGFKGRRSRSLMFAPIRWKGDLVGTLSVQSYTPGAYGRRELDLLQTFADQCGGALARLRSDETLRQSRRATELEAGQCAVERDEAHRLLQIMHQAHSDLDEGVAVAEGPRIIYANQAYCRITGYSEAELLALPTYLDLVPPENRADIAERLRRRERGEAEPDRYESTILHRNGNRVEVEVAVKMFESGGRRQRVVVFRDITERKRAEESLRLAQEKLERHFLERSGELSQTKARLDEQLARRTQADVEVHHQKTLLKAQSEAAPDGILVVSPEGKMISFNARFVEMWGIPADIVASRSDDAALASVMDKLVDPEGFLSRVRYLYEHPEFKSRDEFGLKDGRTFDRYSSPIRGEGGVHYGRVWYFRDVTDRKSGEAALRESEAKWRSLVQNAPDIIMSIDREGKILHINRTVPGFTAESVLGTSVYQYLPPEARALEQETIERVFATGRPETIEIQGAGANGALAWYRTRFGPIERDGKVVALILIVTDITERKQADEELRKSYEILNAIATATIDALFLKDLEGRYLMINPAGAEAIGRKIPEVIGKTDFELFPEETAREIRRMDQIVIVSGRTHTFESNLHMAAGIRTRLATKSVYRDAQGRVLGLIGISRDITERKRTEEGIKRSAEEMKRAYENLKRTQEELIRSEKLASIGMLVSGVAHEINNPIGVIYGNLKLLAEACEMVQPLAIEGARRKGVKGIQARLKSFKGMIRDASRAAEHAKRIVEEFRNFARDARTAEPTDLNQCLDDALALLRKNLGRRIRIVKKYGRIPKVRAFPGQINQVFLNLIKNGAEAIDGRGTVTLKTARVGNSVQIQVSDTGRGIPAELKMKVFEPFFTTKEVGAGLGLGLAVSATIIQNHGGLLSFRSSPSQGTIFTIELPIAR